MVSIQSSHTSFLKCKCSSPFGNLMSCSLLTPWLYSLNCFSCGNVICGISCLCSLSCLSYGNVICGTATISLITCTTIGTANGSTLPLIILCALKSMLSCSFFILELEAPPFSTLLFLLKTLLVTTSASHYSISIALRCASAIVCTSMACYTFNCTSMDSYSSFATTFSSLVSFCIISTSTKCYFLTLSSSNSLMHTGFINLAPGLICSLTHQCCLLLRKNSITYVPVVSMS